jgi:cobalt-zinc-cadmium efflux system protein
MSRHDHAQQLHDHGHHGHEHGPVSYGRAFAIGTLLNAGFVAAEAGFGLAVNSVVLLADAAHNLGDVLGLLMAWWAAWLTQRPPTRRRTYGWGRSSILAALANSVVLLVSVGAIAAEAVQRLIEPVPVGELTVIWVAAAGILINGGTALMFMRGRASDLNIRAAFLHMAGDAGVSAGVVVAGILIGLTGWLWLDPVASLAIAAIILATTWGVLRDSTDLAMDAVPGGIEHEAVESYLRGLPGIVEVHDLHIWALSTTDTALTAHLVYAQEVGHGALGPIEAESRRRFRIGHSTLQVETMADAEACRLRPENVV